jgi:hypothetical protein
MILDILRATPVWVFALFAYLMWMGLARLRTRVRSMRSLWIAPALFVAWGLSGLLGRAGPLAPTLACWIAGAVAGAAIGRRIEPMPSVDRASGTVRQAGSAIPLLRNLALFGTHYLLHVAAAFVPSSAARLMSWDIAVSGLGAGYFIGWAVLVAQVRRVAPSSSVAATLPTRSSP